MKSWRDDMESKRLQEGLWMFMLSARCAGMTKALARAASRRWGRTDDGCELGGRVSTLLKWGLWRLHARVLALRREREAMRAALRQCVALLEYEGTLSACLDCQAVRYKAPDMSVRVCRECESRRALAAARAALGEDGEEPKP